MSQNNIEEKLLIPYMLLRITAIEEIMINKGIITKEEYLSDISSKLNKITEELKNKQ